MNVAGRHVRNIACRARQFLVVPGCNLERAILLDSAMIHRPLVFGTDTPAVMINREQITRLRTFLATRQVAHESRPFQQSYELIRFPGLKHIDVEELLDQMAQAGE